MFLRHRNLRATGQRRIICKGDDTMKRFFRRWPAMLFCLSISFVIIHASSVIAAEKTTNSIIVDFSSGTVGGVKVRNEIADIKLAIGPSRIEETTEELEGQPNEMYIISFGNHKVYKHWNAFSYNDPIFKTKEGLGIGSKVQDFNRLYGKGRVSLEEGFAIYYKTKNMQIAVSTKFIDDRNQDIGLYTNSIVDEIYVW
jgi:hypothetical protein